MRLATAFRPLACAWIFLLASAPLFAQTFYWNRSEYLPNDKDFNRSYNWNSGQNNTGTYPQSDKDDDFTSNTINSAWTTLDATGGAGAGYSLTSAADQLSLSGRGADVYETDNAFYAIHREYRGNFDISVKVVSNSAANEWGKAGIIVADDLNSVTSGGYVYVGVTTSHGVEFKYDIGGDAGQFDAGEGSAVGVTSYPMYLRLVKSGLTYTAFYRTSEASTWTQVGGSNTPTNGDHVSEVGLFVCSHDAGVTATAVFDDFKGGGKINASGLTLKMNASTCCSDANGMVSEDITVAELDNTDWWGSSLSFGGVNGLFATYYDNADFTGTSVARIDTMIQFNWGTGSPDAALGADGFSVAWEGYIQADYSETYTFYTHNDDGYRLWINGSLVRDQWGACCSELSNTVAMTAGVKVPILIHYKEVAGSAQISLKWSSASQPKVYVPKRSLFAGRLNSTGNVTLLHGTIAPGDNGLLEMSAPSGTQILKPAPNGSGTLPRVLHSGAGTLQLSNNALRAMGFYQSAGTLDLNGQDIILSASGVNRGDFQIWNGTSSSFNTTNLAGRTITVAGHASFAGTPGSPLGINPSSTWNLGVSGQLTARDATIRYSNVTASAGFAIRSTSVSNNTNWNVYGKTQYWHENDVLASTDANKAHNWTINQDGTGWRPMSASDDYFDSRTLAAAWTFQDVDADSGTGSWALSGGQLQLSGRGTDAWSSNNHYVQIYRTDLTGDWDVSVKVVDVSPNTGYGKWGINVADNMANLADGGYCHLVAYRDGGTNLYSVKLERASTSNATLDAVVVSAATNLALPLWLRLVKNGTAFHAYYKTTMAAGWTSVGSATPVNGHTSSHVGLMAVGNDAAATKMAIFDDFQAGQNISATDLDLSFAGTGTNNDANATLTANLAGASLDFTNYTGTFDFGSSTLTVNSGNATFVSGMTIQPNAGVLDFTAGSGTQTFTPKSGALHPTITKSGNGTVTVATNGLTSQALTVSGGTWNWGSSTLTHVPASINLTSGNTMVFGTNTVQTTGGVTFNGTVTVNTGTLAFTGTSGTQVFIPQSSANPHITHTGASTLQLSTNNLSTLSFSNSGGPLDLNGRNITTTGGGNFTITNGTPTTLVGLGGRTLTVAGATSLSGSSGSLLNLNPASGWTVASTGALTAAYANIGNSNASVSAGVPNSSVNSGNNTNWNFLAADFSAWRFSTRIRFNTTSTGANVSGNVADFPMLVRLNAENFLFEQARVDGRDIRFQDPDGSALYYSIDRWDLANKVAEIWVKVPQVDGNSDRDYITMFWGHNTASSASSASGTFAAYKIVYHLGENPAGTAPQFKDSSNNANHGTAQNGAVSDSVTSVIGKGFKLNGSSRYITSTTQFSNIDIFTYGTWFRTTSGSGGLLMGFQGTQTGGGGSHDRKVYMGDNGRLNYGVYNGGHFITTTSASYNDGQWHHMVARMDANGLNLFVDGVSVATHAQNDAESNAGYWRAGWGEMGGWTNDPTNDYFTGSMDELFVSHTSLSADYIKLMYQTQKANSKVAAMENTGLSGWSYSTKVFVNTTSSGASITTSQTNYPLLVRLTNANFPFSQARSDGGDLRFADSAGNLLPYEIERWNSTSKLAEVWVLLPTVYGNNNSQWFRMHWGRSAATSLSSGPAVFLGSAGYVGVYHLNEDGNTTAGGYKDASSAENHGQGINFDANVDLAANVGLGTSFATASNQGIHIAHHASQSPATAITVQAWFYNYSLGAYRRIVQKPYSLSQAPWNQFSLEVDDGGDNVNFSLTLGANVEAGVANTTVMSINNWYQATGTYDGSTQRLYFNGNQEGSLSRSGAIVNYSQVLAIGKFGLGTGSNWDGIIDEVRVSNVARSADWVKLDYQTTRSGSTVVTVGERSLSYAKSTQFNFNTAGAGVTGNVTNIPILVRLNSATLDFTAVRDDAADLKFVDRDGSNLYHEVVEWDKGNKTGKAWVKVPQVDGNSTNDYIVLYYGCSACTGNPYALRDSVWSGYSGVWHLDGSGAGAQDASVNANHGTFSHGMAMSPGLTTELNPSFDGSANSATIPNHAALDGETTTLSFWVKTTDAGNNATWYHSKILMERDVPGDNDDWGLALQNGNGKLVWATRNSTFAGKTDIGNGAWRHVAMVKSTANQWFYIDGVLDSTRANADVISNDAPLYLASEDASENFFRGQLNELSLHPSNRSADFIRLSYQNQRENSTLLSAAVTASAFSASKVFKFNTTASGANVSGDVHDFPLLLRFTDATLIDATQSAGQDIRFLDSDGVTWLPYQIERWDQAGNVGEIWVKVPKVDGNSNSDFITMYYNDVTNGSVPDGQCGTCVFSSGAGYVGAWHLGETGGTSVTDATTYGRSGTKLSSTEPNPAGGLIGYGQDFDGVNDWINLGANQNFVNSASEVTLEAWVKADAIPGSLSAPLVSFSINNGGTATPNSRAALEINSDGRPRITGRSTEGETLRNGYYTSAISVGSWYHLQGVLRYSEDLMTICLNGACRDTAIAFDGNFLPATASASASIGAEDDGAAKWLDGMIDEVRVSTVRRSDDWAKLSYESQKASPTLFNSSPADFVSTRKYTFNTTKTGADVMGDVESFPLLVRITGSAIVDAVQNDYDDIRFLDGDGKTWLQYQVERWDKAKDSAEVWVLVPRVDGNSNTDHITLYYDDVTNGAVPNGECGQCVFSPSQGWSAAWHLNEDGNTSVSGYLDATGNANHGQGVAMTSSSDVPGIAGMGQDFDGSTQYIRVADGTTLDPASLTLSAWVKVGAGFSHLGQIIDKGGNSGYRYRVNSNRAVRVLDRGVVNDLATASPDTLATSQWQHVVATASASGLRIYLNGTLRASNSTAYGAPNTADSLRIGKYLTATSENMEGAMDEVSVSSVVRSADWIKLSYETQRPSGNVFWNSRPGPNNKSTLTATDGVGSISLSWTKPVSDSANADSVGIWVKYSGKPDSVGATGQTKVVILPKADSAYSYPATYPGTYYFGLAVRNASGQWSPFTSLSTDTVQQQGSGNLTDTIYVDSAIGTTAGGTAQSCTDARNPATPLKEVEEAVWCAQASGFVPNDSLVIRVMPGAYTGTYDNDFQPPSTYPVVVTSFDNNSRAVLSSVERAQYTVGLNSNMTLRRINVRAATNASAGIKCFSSADSVVIDGVQIYNNGNVKHDTGIVITSNGNEGNLITNSVIHEPTRYGILQNADDRTNIIGNVFIGTGAANTKGIIMDRDAWGSGYVTITNNIFSNWNYGIQTTDANSEIGVVSNNLFHLVTTGNEVVGETDAAKITKDPLFFTTALGSPHAFKLLPGSPAVDAGTATISTGANEAWPRIATSDRFGTSRPQGAALDIGLYEGSGHTSNPTGAFDSLTNAAAGDSVVVKNSQFKLVWKTGRGGGITGFYDMTGDTTANLAPSNNLLFDVRLDGYVASSQTSNVIAPTFQERTRARSIVRQRLALSASLELNVYYTVHASGHVWIESEISNLGGSTLDLDIVQYTLKLAAASDTNLSAGGLSDTTFRNGYAWLQATGKDAFLSASRDLKPLNTFTETWGQAGGLASIDSVSFQTADMADPIQNMKRRHHFLLYVGDNSLDAAKSATLNADAYAPSPIVASAGSVLHERSWQDRLAGHWNFDEGDGDSAQDRSITYSNDGVLASVTWVAGKVNSALRFTTSSLVTVADNDALEARAGFAVAFWVKPDFSAMQDNAFILHKGTGNTDGWRFAKTPGANSITFRVGTQSIIGPPLATATWHHIAGSLSHAGVLHLYVNGVLVAASTVTASAVANGDALKFGRNDGSDTRFAGDLDDVRIYHITPSVGNLQSFVNQGFSQQRGYYHLRADNNNRVVVVLDDASAATRIQPAFHIDNWYGAAKTPKHVYLNGVKLIPNVDFVSDSIWNATGTWNFGYSLVLQLNKVLAGSSQTLFVDDDDSTGYLGTAGKMKSLTMSVTANDKMVFQNFAGSSFGSINSGQWYLELDLNGWTTPGAEPATAGFGEFNSWKAAAINPSVSVSSATEQVGLYKWGGRTLSLFYMDNNGGSMHGSGRGYAGPANISYTVIDSSSTRASFRLDTMTFSNAGSASIVKRWTVYPTGRIIGSFQVTTSSFSMNKASIFFQGRYGNFQVYPTWSDANAIATGRFGLYRGETDFHSLVGGALSVKSAGAIYSSPAGMIFDANDYYSNATNDDYSEAGLYFHTSLFESTDDPITVNFAMDISKDFADSATADSLMKDLQTPATITALGAGTANPADGLDFNTTPDGFAEGDAAYVFTAGSGVAHFRFVNTVTHFNPAFRIKQWTYQTLPEYVIVDNQTLNRGYQYNAYVNTATSELILQLNKTLKPGTHTFYIAHKTGLAVKLNHFEAVGLEGVDSLAWTTESEFENLGFHVWRRVAPVQDLPDSLFAGAQMSAGTGIANALMEQVRVQAAAKKAADSLGADSLPETSLSSEQLQAMGYVRLTAKLIPGAKGGSSATTHHYHWIDRTAGFGTTYEYLLEAVDFNGVQAQYGPRKATPRNPLETALLPNYPNPFNPVTTLRFSLKEKSRVSLVIYDARGRVVRTLLRAGRPMLPGKYRLIWDAKDDKGFEVPSGQYFYRFSVPGFQKTRKMILVK